MAILGILSTNVIFFALSALGVGALIIASVTLFTILKWIGAAYLVYLGVGMVVPLLRSWRYEGKDNQGLNLESARQAVAKEKQSNKHLFWKGFSLQASNPKNLAFFVAILPQFISVDGNLALQLTVLGIVSILLELPILVVYGLASSLSAHIMRDRLIKWIEGIGGGILITLGVALAMSHK